MQRPTESPDAPGPPYAGLDPVTLAVRDVIAGSHEQVGRMAKRMGMSANDVSAIGALVQHGAMGVTELAEHLGIRPASVTEMVDRLERSGHVQRVRDGADRRRVRIIPTDAARTASTEAWSSLVLGIDEVCSSLSSSQRDTILAFLERLTAVVAQRGH